MAEKEYIDKEFVMNTINELKAKPLPKTIGLEHLQQIIEDISANDIVKVVRCKDCKHYDKKYHQCKLHSEEPDQYYTGFIFCMQEDDFCSYGERKELDNDKT